MSGIDPLGNSEPTYLQIANTMADRIRSGYYAHMLPGERALAAEFGVAYETQRHAMKVLRQRGLIIARQGRGTFLASSIESASSSAANPEVQRRPLER